jgi:hypothetical protein
VTAPAERSACPVAHLPEGSGDSEVARHGTPIAVAIRVVALEPHEALELRERQLRAIVRVLRHATGHVDAGENSRRA